MRTASATCVVYEDPESAREAWSALRRSPLEPPTQITIHQGEVSQDQVAVPHTHSRMGALAGALVVGLPTAIFLSVAASSEVFASLRMTTAFAIGLIGGGLLGALTGMLVGATEPRPLLRRARDAVRRGRVALVARFRCPEDADRAHEFLLARPGAFHPHL